VPAWPAASAAYGKPHSPAAAAVTLVAWLREKGPCVPFTDTSRAYGRIRRLAAAQGFEEIPPLSLISELWKNAHKKWRAMREEPAETDDVVARPRQ